VPFFQKCCYKWQLEEIPRCRSGQFNYFISKNGEKIPLNHVLGGFFFWIFKLQNFATIKGKKNSKLVECAEYVVAISACLNKNR
jgi:hypothetical protein